MMIVIYKPLAEKHNNDQGSAERGRLRETVSSL